MGITLIDEARNVRTCTVLENWSLVLLPISGICNHMCVGGPPKSVFVIVKSIGSLNST